VCRRPVDGVAEVLNGLAAELVELAGKTVWTGRQVIEAGQG
jgi:ClpP class serine protease